MSGYPIHPKDTCPPRRLTGLIPLFTLVAAHHAVAHPVPAPSAAAPPVIADSDVITVTAPLHSPLTVVTSPKTPRQPLPASDGAGYLKTIPGFAQIRNGGTNGDPVFRGMFGSRLKILADGAEILGTCPSRMDAPTAYISPESYDVLTLVKGPQTVLWGPGSSAGTLRFERVFPHFDKAGVKTQLGLLAGSNGRRDETVQAAVGNALGYMQLSANQSRAGDYRDGAGRRVPSRWDKWNGDLALGWTPDDATRMELTLGRGNGEASYAGRGMDGAQIKRESLGARFEKTGIGDVLDRVEAQLYYSYANHVMDNTSLRSPVQQPAAARCCTMRARQGPPNAARRSNPDRRTLGGRAAGTWLWTDFQLQSGADMQTNTHRVKKSTGWDRDARFQDYGVFSELTWHASGHNRIIGGARLDRSLADKYDDTGSRSRAAILPAGFIRYEQQLSAPLLWYAGIGYTERFPDYWELFKPKAGPRPGSDPFAALKSEKTTQIDAGWHYVNGGFNGWLSGYAGRVDDFILVKYDPNNAYGSQAVNISAHIMGAELGMGYRLAEHWKTDASLAWSWGKNTRDGRPLPQMPPLDARAGLTYERQRFSSTALWRVVSAQRRIAANQGNAAGKDFAASPGFGVLSANVAYRLTKGIKLSSGVDNILDKRYSEHLNLAGNSGFGYAADRPITEPGRTLWGRVNMVF
ncbi:TonB-dependent copper receptor [Sodalis sp. C49]|uniref:TonB-dependent copper receptor n=1 Tax=Sodalis sp. C49 TaxID=3228929 RepID=UPI003965AE19